MKYSFPVSLILSLFIFASCAPTGQISNSPTQTISSFTSGMEHYEGFYDFYWDDNTGKIWLNIDRFEEDFLYINALATGLGSNDIGLDRGQIGQDRLVHFYRSGNKVLLVQPNLNFRAITDNHLEKRSVDEAFAQSVLWGFTIHIRENDQVLVDATDFFLRDAFGVATRLQNMNQGNHRLDDSRSAMYLPRTKNFPKNSEFEAILTFTGDQSGAYLRSVAPSNEAVTVRQHHSFVELPDDNYKPRVFDPRSGFYPRGFQNYSAGVADPFIERFIPRHRLEKVDPDAEMSEAVEPIIFYVDSGAPEPIRTALIEGAQWWEEAFEAAGFKNAYKVKVLPEDVDPLDVRYNVIQWVHRSTRGWSYGRSVVDPRTGEIIKGHVSLGSLRIRQDYLIAEGLLAPYEEGVEADPVMKEMALARIRQLSAHEVGHTIGIAHNFAASVNDRASVMDYPHPKVIINEDGSFDLSDAYDDAIGEWDKRVVMYGYTQFADEESEKVGLQKIIERNIDLGLQFISDLDARPEGGAHPYAHLWDNGEDAVAQMDHLMDVRRRALSRFSEANIQEGRPMSTLEDVLVPMYLYHRFQLEATVKILAGLNYTYAIRDDGQPVAEIVDPQWQREALNAMLKTVRADELALPEQIIALIPPKAYGYSYDREQFNRRTGLPFDAIGIAEAAADPVFRLLLNGQRAARLVEYNSRNPENPGLEEVIDAILMQTWTGHSSTGYRGEVERVVDRSALYHLMHLSANSSHASQVRAIATQRLKELANELENNLGAAIDNAQLAHWEFAIDEINRFLANPESFEIPSALPLPPGAPIGMGCGSELSSYSNH